MAELIFIPLVVALLALGLNQNSSCKHLTERNTICGINNNNNECFKPLNSYRLEDSEKITQECVSYINKNNFFSNNYVDVYVTDKRESMTPSDAMNQAIRKCTEKNVSGVGIDDRRLYYVCVWKPSFPLPPHPRRET
jgi:hypothetical protein